MTVMTCAGLQWGYSSNPYRFLELMDLIAVGAGYFPDFEVEDLTRERFMDLYLKLCWNYRDVMVLYFTMRRSQKSPPGKIVFDNLRKALFLLHLMIHAMSNAMVGRIDFTSDEVRAFLFDSDMHLNYSEDAFLYLQYTIWVDFMYDIFMDQAEEKMQQTLNALDTMDVANMMGAGARLDELESQLFIFVNPLFHLTRPINFESSTLPKARTEMERQMAALERRMTIVGDGQMNGATTEIGFPRMVAPWVDAQVLVARPKRVPVELGDHV